MRLKEFYCILALYENRELGILDMYLHFNKKVVL
jgi:hypothetical protein